MSEAQAANDAVAGCNESFNTMARALEPGRAADALLGGLTARRQRDADELERRFGHAGS